MSQLINCLIVDDEPIARQIIETYCSHLPELKVVASCSTVFDAKPFLQNNQIDILFLDINMPVLDGVSFLKTLKKPPQVIFTTAYKEYAIDAFDLAACDYLVKPFSLERFMVAVDKAIEKRKDSPDLLFQKNEGKAGDSFFIKADGKVYKINYQDLLFAEAKGNYTKIVTTLTNIITGMTFSSFEEQLPKEIFIRVHRSFIINKSKITHIEGNRVFIDKNEISIGSNYKENFLKLLGL